MNENPIIALSQICEKIKEAKTWIKGKEDACDFLAGISDRITTVRKELERERERFLNPSPTGENVLEVLNVMERYADRHWMHDEGQSVREFVNRLKRAYLAERNKDSILG